jgi:hypothetical protein
MAKGCRRTALGVSLGVALSGALAAGCSSIPSHEPSDRGHDGGRGFLAETTTDLVESAGPGWTASGLEGPVLGPGRCHYRSAADGSSLPDPTCTPGAVDGSVTQDDLARTVCAAGFARAVRPPQSITERFKYSSMKEYAASHPVWSYELDHLVPLEIGGSSDTRNLWPEPDDHPWPGVANSKDIVEGELHELVCNAVHDRAYLPLSLAQRLVAVDWTTALERARRSLVPVRDGSTSPR